MAKTRAQRKAEKRAREAQQQRQQAADPNAEQAAEADGPRLAEPKLTGGRVEAVMGELIRVLSHSRLARPLPAIILSALGLAGVAFNGLCATAPAPSIATPPPIRLGAAKPSAQRCAPESSER